MFLLVRGRSLRRGNQRWGVVRMVGNCHEPQPVVQPEIDDYTSHIDMYVSGRSRLWLPHGLPV
jgi:hypothetical protein